MEAPFPRNFTSSRSGRATTIGPPLKASRPEWVRAGHDGFMRYQACRHLTRRHAAALWVKAGGRAGTHPRPPRASAGTAGSWCARFPKNSRPDERVIAKRPVISRILRGFPGR